MPEIIVPTWADFTEIVQQATMRLLVCTPYYSREGIGRLFDSLNPSASLHFWTRLSPSDWMTGVADPNELVELLELIRESGPTVELGINQRLHAKAYIADSNLALIGSANLSTGGFEGNLELMVRFRDSEASNAKASIERFYVDQIKPMSIDALRRWTEETQPIIDQVRAETVDWSEALAPAQASLDELLGFGIAPTGSVVEPTRRDLEAFIAWLHSNDNLPGAQAIVDQWFNNDGNNRGGHVKQSFHAATRFLSEYPEMRQRLSSKLAMLATSDIYQMQLDSEVSSAWKEHVDAHAKDSGDDYSYSTLRTILPPALGGTVLGGGGGSGTIKRILPLVARYEVERQA